MRAHQLCHSTVVLDAKYDNLPGVEYFDVKTDRGSYRFAQGVPAVLPTLLEELSLWRKKAKREMAEAKQRGDAFAASVFNARQLAYKVHPQPDKSSRKQMQPLVLQSRSCLSL